MNIIKKLKYDVDSLYTNVNEYREFFSSIVYFVEQLQKTMNDIPANIEDIEFLSSKIEEFYKKYRRTKTSPGVLYIAPMETKNSDATVQEIIQIVKELKSMGKEEREKLNKINDTKTESIQSDELKEHKTGVFHKKWYVKNLLAPIAVKIIGGLFLTIILIVFGISTYPIIINMSKSEIDNSTNKTEVTTEKVENQTIIINPNQNKTEESKILFEIKNRPYVDLNPTKYKNEEFYLKTRIEDNKLIIMAQFEIINSGNIPAKNIRHTTVESITIMENDKIIRKVDGIPLKAIVELMPDKSFYQLVEIETPYDENKYKYIIESIKSNKWYIIITNKVEYTSEIYPNRVYNTIIEVSVKYKEAELHHKEIN